MNYKKETINLYDTHALQFDREYAEYFQRRVIRFADQFIQQLSMPRTVLDLGSGPGHHAQYFQKQGIDVLCADLSEKMITLCHAKGLRAIDMDIENINLPKNSFDGIWAYTSLLHVPKNKISGVISRIECILKPQGILAVALKEGNGEGFEEHKNNEGQKRWISYYSEQEAQKLFPNFTLIDYAKEVSPNIKSSDSITFLHFLMRSNKTKE